MLSRCTRATHPEQPLLQGKRKCDPEDPEKASKCSEMCDTHEKSKVDGGKALSLLREDLVNGPLHVFGVHTRCSTDFCTVRQQQQSQQSPSEARNTDPTDDEENCDQTGDDGSESGHHGGEEDDDADLDGTQYL